MKADIEESEEGVATPAQAGDAATEELFRDFVVPNYGRLPLDADHGEGARLWDEAGRRYLDFATGIAVCSLGHSPAVLREALADQAGRLVHCSNLYRHREQGLLARRLVRDVMGLDGKCFFCNSGAEANEALVKLARKFGHAVPMADGTPRTGILTFTGSFHGRTMAGISATGQEKVKTGFAPLLPGFRHLPFNDVTALENAVSEDTVAILLEPVQGEGGIHVATAEFLEAASAVARRHNLLLLVDDVQAGIGRTGHLRSWDAVLGGRPAGAAAFEPDAVSWAKGLGGGIPVGAVWIGRREVPGDRLFDGAAPVPLCDLLGPGSHGTTFGGTPLISRGARAVLEEILGRDLCANASETGRWILERAAAWRFPAIREVRGLGLILGFVLEPKAVEAAPGFRESGTTPAIFVVRRLMAEGLLTAPAAGEVIRWLPPLNVTRAEVEEAFAIMERVLGGLSPETGEAAS